MAAQKNIIIPGSEGLPIALDIFYASPEKANPVVIYAHGFNGFKDWGNFDMIAEKFAAAGFTFIKFNFSHNGTTPEHPEEFNNLEAFGQNNYSKQLADLSKVINWICDPENPYHRTIDSNRLYLMGHSMGGGIAILYASKDERIQKLVTWAAISECKTPWGSWTADKIQEWKSSGVAYYNNSRTKQQMPMYYQLFEDFQQNRDMLNIQQAIGQLKIPVLICHGKDDQSVPVISAKHLHAWQPQAELFISDGDHVFDRKHPWPEKSLPPAMQTVLDKTIGFLKKH